MRSDVICVKNDGEGFAEALLQAEKTARFNDLSDKNAIHLRLLTEEMMGVLRALTGEREAKFWIDAEGGAFELHLCANAPMNTEMRKKLLSVSTTGENSAVKGVTGKLRDLFQRLLEPEDGSIDASLAMGVAYGFIGADIGNMYIASPEVWSLDSYRAAAKAGRTPPENWDELERSVVARLADDVKIGISGNDVEMTIIKKF